MNRLTKFAAGQQQAFDAATTPMERKDRGHFGTPANVASFMAGMLTIKPNCPVFRILDAGAGVGILSVAVCDAVLRHRDQLTLYIEAWENDPKLIAHLRATLVE